ncbi:MULTISPECIES: potassium-transporting ATPase subunit F [unclassified Arthrobacter]|nr:potassium-transporting ATPase subunit F [Arthrobacter sp. YD4]MDN3935861.1 potassium-transporting ATPase subunit F [Arthrobacter sp. YD4]
MNAEAVMWVVLFLAGLGLTGYLLAVLINPEKW